ncbi:MAG: zf-HC2 domain-containing protein [Acidobacteriota bacterium]|nr:zf-HC2 domain-containing protein [Acidobacteriota bacterium]
MECTLIREAVSALLDGEAPPPSADPVRVEAHLASCGNCREWAAGVQAMIAEWRVGAAPVVPDMTERLLYGFSRLRPVRTGFIRWFVRSGWPERGFLPDRFSRPAPNPGSTDSGAAARVAPSALRGRSVASVAAAARVGLVLAALVELALTVPILVLGHDREAPLHVAHEMGSFGLAVAWGFLAAAVRPRLASGLAWLVGVAAASLVVTAGVDLGRGLTSWADEAAHLPVVGGALLLWTLSRLQPRNVDDVTAVGPVRGRPDPGAAGFGLRVVPRGRIFAGPLIAREERRAS